MRRVMTTVVTIDLGPRARPTVAFALMVERLGVRVRSRPRTSEQTDSMGRQVLRHGTSICRWTEPQPWRSGARGRVLPVRTT